MFWGVGWQDYQSSPTRTLYLRFCCSSPHAENSSSPRVAKHPGTVISRPPGSCSPSRTSHLSAHGFHAQEFSWFHPHCFSFPSWISEWCGSVLYSWADLWVQHCDWSRTSGETVKFVPSMVCVRFPLAVLVLQNGPLFPHVMSYVCCYLWGLL